MSMFEKMAGKISEQDIATIEASKFEGLLSYLLENMSTDEDDQLNLGLNGLTFNVYLKCAACNGKLARPVIMIGQAPVGGFVVCPDCKSNVVLEEEEDED